MTVSPGRHIKRQTVETGETDGILIEVSALDLKPKKMLNKNGFPEDFFLSPFILLTAAVNMSL